MKIFEVYLKPDGVSDLKDIYEYIADKSGHPDIAIAYIRKLRSKCEDLSLAPVRGQQRDDLRKNLRTLAIDKNAVAAFVVDEKRKTVTILNIFYGGRDFDALMRDD